MKASTDIYKNLFENLDILTRIVEILIANDKNVKCSIDTRHKLAEQRMRLFIMVNERLEIIRKDLQEVTYGKD